MKTTKYAELDSAICEHIERGKGHPHYSDSLINIARPLLSKKTPFPEEWRLIDRRMQAMRKAGRLVYERPSDGGRAKWRVAAIDGADRVER